MLYPVAAAFRAILYTKAFDDLFGGILRLNALPLYSQYAGAIRLPSLTHCNLRVCMRIRSHFPLVIGIRALLSRTLKYLDHRFTRGDAVCREVILS